MEIKSYIDENYATIGSVADLASQFFYSREHISRIFKYYFNTSITEYLMRKRIEARQGGTGRRGQRHQRLYPLRLPEYVHLYRGLPHRHRFVALCL